MKAATFRRLRSAVLSREVKPLGPSLARRQFSSMSHGQKMLDIAKTNKKRAYYWITEEAEVITARAYKRHLALQDMSCGQTSYPASLQLTKEELESLEECTHYEPKTRGDKMAKAIVGFLGNTMDRVFGERYDAHACVLECVAAVPGMVAGFARHMSSLRTMHRDYGWINPLLEEAENERMHLLIWMQVTEPRRYERWMIFFVQTGWAATYSLLYAFAPATAHRIVGYLEQLAQQAYTDYLHAVDAGAIENEPAPIVAIKYYRLPEDATIRDVILYVRADEIMHQHFNHMLSNNYRTGRDGKYRPPQFMHDKFPHELKADNTQTPKDLWAPKGAIGHTDSSSKATSAAGDTKAAQKRVSRDMS